jgi:hypothetical protein
MTDLLEKYTTFLESKAVAAVQSGFEVSVDELNPILPQAADENQQ